MKNNKKNYMLVVDVAAIADVPCYFNHVYVLIFSCLPISYE